MAFAVLLAVGLRALLAAAIAAPPAHFSSFIDAHRAPTHGDGYDVYAVTASARSLCPQCKIDVEHVTSSGSKSQWMVRVGLPETQGMVTPALAALRALVAPAVPSTFAFTSHTEDCDGASQTLVWSRIRETIEASASVDPDAGANAVSREVLVTGP